MGFSRQEYWSGVPLPSPFRGLAMPKGLTHSNKHNVFQKFSRRSFLFQKLHLHGGIHPLALLHSAGAFIIVVSSPTYISSFASGPHCPVSEAWWWLEEWHLVPLVVPTPTAKQGLNIYNPSLLSLIFLWIITGDIASEYSLPPDMQAKIYKNKSISYILTITSLKIKAIKNIICLWMILRILWDFHAESHKTRFILCKRRFE